MSESRLTNCGTGSSNWQMRTRRRAEMEKPRRSTPAASDKAKLATSRDLPTLGSPPTNRCPVVAAVPVPPGRAVQTMAAVRATAPETAPSVMRTLSRRHCSQQRLGGGIQQDRFPNRSLFARSCQTQSGQGQFVDLAKNAFGGLIEGLPGGVVKQRLGHAGSL